MATGKVDTKNFVWITKVDPQNNNSGFKLDSY